MKKIVIPAFAIFSTVVITLIACSKGGGGDTPTPPADACTGVTITVSGTAISASTCATTGSITATGAGGAGLTYSLNAGAFQASGTFSNLAGGSYTIVAKDSKGCTGQTTIVVGAGTAAAGPLFTAVKSLMAANCQSCHNNSIQNGGMNWTVDCNIVANKTRIKARAVDNVPSSMPPTGPLAQGDKDKITAWINAGGNYTD